MDDDCAKESLISKNVPKLPHPAPLFEECDITKEMVNFTNNHNDLTLLSMLDLFKLQTDVSTRVTRFNQTHTLYVPK